MIYPNLASPILIVNPNFATIKATCRITNLLDQVTTSRTIENNSVNISRLKDGVFLMELTDKEETFAQKFIEP